MLALLVLTPLLIRELGTEKYGVLVTLTSTAAVIAMFDFGIANGLISKIASIGWQSPRTRSVLSAASVLLILASAIGALASVVLTSVLPWPRWLNASSVGEVELRWAVLFSLLGAALALTVSLGQKVDLARQRGHAVALWSTAAAISGPVGALVIARLGYGLPAVVAAAALVPQLVLACQTAQILGSLPRELRPGIEFATRAELIESLRTGAAFMGLSVVILVSFQVDTLIVSSILGASAAAHFSVVVRLFDVVKTTMQSSLSQLWSAFAEALSRGDLQWVRRTLLRASVFGGAVALGASAALVVLAPWFIDLWLGAEFHPPMGVLLGAAMWTTYSIAIHPITMFLNGAQLQRAELLAAIPMAVLNVALSIALTREIGSPGPLLGSLIAHVACAGIPLGLLTLGWLRKREGLRTLS